MFSARSTPVLLLLCGVLLTGLAAIVVFGGLLPPSVRKEPAPLLGPPAFEYRIVGFGDLPGWLQDDPTTAFEAFLRSCAVMAAKSDAAPANPFENLGALEGIENQGEFSLGGAVGDWRDACVGAGEIAGRVHADPAARRGDIRTFFEFYFQPVQALVRRDPLDGDGPPQLEERGTFTGYFEPVYRASRTETPDHGGPLYPRPDDLVDVDLGLFRDDLRGERIAGRIAGNRFVPYPAREDIYDGALAGAVEPLAWLDETDLFFLQIQGSGQLVFDDGEVMRVNYAGQNGRAYTAVGRVLRDRGLMALEDISMQTIRAWLESADPAEARALRVENESYVFFRALESADLETGPIGAQGAPLTAGRSIAVDRRFHALGAPVFVDIEPVDGALDQFRGAPIRRLMVAQDTGGAIRGPVRGDYYWGAGPEAGAVAGRMNAQGRMFVLLPKPVVARLEARSEFEARRRQ